MHPISSLVIIIYVSLNIDAEFQEKVVMLQSIKETENYSPFHDVVEDVLSMNSLLSFISFGKL